MKAPEGSEPRENPLVPHGVLRQMYTSMMEVRLLDQQLQSKRRGRSTEGAEAALAAVLLSLTAGDLVLGATESPGLDLLPRAGADLTSRLRRAPLKEKERVAAAPVRVPFAGADLLPYIADADTRLAMALGVASCARLAARQQATVVFLRHRELRKQDWKFALAHAIEHELPIFFIVLPRSSGEPDKGSTHIRELARKVMLPGIPVDSSDSIALYRVTQEALGRIRGGDGPVLMECISFKLPNTPSRLREDAVARLQHYLLERKIVDAEWIGRIQQEFGASLKNAGRSRRKSRPLR